jgi:hypothetical protein
MEPTMSCTSSPLEYLAAFAIAFAAGFVTALGLSKLAYRSNEQSHAPPES